MQTTDQHGSPTGARLRRSAELLNIRNRFRIFLQRPFRHNVPNGNLIPKRFHLDNPCGTRGAELPTGRYADEVDL